LLDASVPTSAPGGEHWFVVVERVVVVVERVVVVVERVVVVEPAVVIADVAPYCLQP
jgi:hypothetical protein